VANGANPFGGLIQATDGSLYGMTNFYGVTSFNDSIGEGTVFKLSMGLGPFIKPLPAYGAVGSAVTILGTDLAGATEVSFNGTAATFTVVSASSIKATLPAGATSGTILVTLPSGTLSSNLHFRVLQ